MTPLASSPPSQHPRDDISDTLVWRGRRQERKMEEGTKGKIKRVRERDRNGMQHGMGWDGRCYRIRKSTSRRRSAEDDRGRRGEERIWPKLVRLAEDDRRRLPATVWRETCARDHHGRERHGWVKQNGFRDSADGAAPMSIGATPTPSIIGFLDHLCSLPARVHRVHTYTLHHCSRAQSVSLDAGAPVRQSRGGILPRAGAMSDSAICNARAAIDAIGDCSTDRPIDRSIDSVRRLCR